MTTLTCKKYEEPRFDRLKNCDICFDEVYVDVDGYTFEIIYKKAFAWPSPSRTQFVILRKLATFDIYVVPYEHFEEQLKRCNVEI